MKDSIRILEYTVPAGEEGLSVKDIMKTVLGLSTKEIARCKHFEDGVLLKREGGDFSFSRVIEKVKAGDILRISLHEDNDNSSEIIPADGVLDIVYEDEDLILLNKPGNVVVHPSYAHYKDSLSNILAGYYEKTGQQHVIRVIGRLDRETSGLIIFAKNRHSAALLSDQTRNMSRRKEYLALCSGVFEETEGTVDAPIAEIPGQRMIREVREDGKEAVTHYRVEQQFEDYALVRLHLDTGRTHQIRVHMKYIGHPLLGDGLYGTEIPDHHEMKRTALHAVHLEFKQPISGKELIFDADLPEDMAAHLPS
jgi:23S rRNA pseudouridine1911/1915/1917 synthase